MRAIAILNQKGGVGKTTTAVNLSAALQRNGGRVLLIDLDPQSHATLHVGLELAPEDASVYDVLVNGVPVAEAARSVSEGLTIVPSSVDLVGAELEMADRPNRERILADALTPYSGGFDFCIIDCAPSLGLLTVNALTAAAEVIIPLQPHFLALQGLGRLLETVTAVRQSTNPQLRVLGVVLSMFERGTKLAQEVRDDVRAFFAAASPHDAWHAARLFDTAIRRNIKLAESPSFGKTIFDYEPHSHGAADYMALAQEILAPPVAAPSPVRSMPAEAVPADPDSNELSRPIAEGIITAPPQLSGRTAPRKSFDDAPPLAGRA